MKQYKPVLAAVLLSALLFCACDDSLKIEKNPDIKYAWLVGDAASGWSDSNGNPITRPMPRAEKDIFEYRGNLTTGFLKINCDEIPDWDGRWYLPANDTVLNNNKKQAIVFSAKGDGGETGFKWEINESGHYYITLNKKSSTIECSKTGDFRPEIISDKFNHMWLIIAGTKLPMVDLPESHEMEKSGDDWTITTQAPLRSGWYVKFNGEDTPRTVWESAANPWYSSKWFTPPDNDDLAVGTVNFRYGGENALAWKITATKKYTITLRPKNGTVIFTPID